MFVAVFDLATLVQFSIYLYGFVLLTVLFLTIYQASLMDEKKLLFHVREVAWLQRLSNMFMFFVFDV